MSKQKTWKTILGVLGILIIFPWTITAQTDADVFDVTHIPCGQLQGGAIEIDASLFPGKTFQWNNGNKTNKIDNLAPGRYSVSVMDGPVVEHVYQAHVAYVIDWAEVGGSLTIQDDGLAKDGDDNWGSHARAHSNNELSPYQDGWMEVTFVQGPQNIRVGFSETPNSIKIAPKYGIWCRSKRLFFIKNKVVLPGYVEIPEGIGIGDRLRVARVGNKIQLYFNSTLLHEYEVNESENLLTDILIEQKNTAIKDVSCSAPCVQRELKQYASLQSQLDGSYFPAQEDEDGNLSIYFIFNEEYQSGSLNIKLFDLQNSYQEVTLPAGNLSNIETGNAEKIIGTNRFKIDVSELVAGNFYILQVENDKGEKQMLRIKI